MANKLFISYAREDIEDKEQLLKQLKVLEDHGFIDTWDDSEIDAGDQWKEEIERELEASNVIIFLVSSDFLVSQFIKEVEMKRGIELYEQGKIKIFPVILNDCHWDKTFLKHFQALPLDEKQRLEPVSAWEDKNAAFFQISDSILKSLNPDKGNEMPPLKPRTPGVEVKPPIPPPPPRKKRGITYLLGLLVLVAVVFVGWEFGPELFRNDDSGTETTQETQPKEDEVRDTTMTDEQIPINDSSDTDNGTGNSTTPPDPNDDVSNRQPDDMQKTPLSKAIVRFLSDKDNYCYSAEGVRNIGGKANHYPLIRNFSESEIKESLEQLILLGLVTHNCKDTRSYRIVLNQPQLISDYLRDD